MSEPANSRGTPLFCVAGFVVAIVHAFREFEGVAERQNPLGPRQKFADCRGGGDRKERTTCVRFKEGTYEYSYILFSAIVPKLPRFCAKNGILNK